MSEKIRKRTGLLLLGLCILLCMLPWFLSQSDSDDFSFQSGSRLNWRLEALRPVSDGNVTVNHAGTEELTLLPGVGQVYADHIISEREMNGPFFYPEDLEVVKGIGPKTIEKILPFLNLTY